MAKTLCRVAGGGKPLKGNAETGDVLAGKTFSNKQSNALTGSMPNNGALNVTLTPSGNNSTSQAVAAGYYSGGTITANGSSSYSKGVSDADGRVNTSSASYNSGYTKGRSDGYNSGYTNGQSAKAVGGMGAVYGFSGNGVEFSKTLPPGTYAWGVSMHSQYWCKYKISHGGTVVGSNMNGAERIYDTGTFSISSNEKCSIWLQAYGGGGTEIAGGYIVRTS